MVIGLVSGFSLFNYSDSGSFLVAHGIALPRWRTKRRILGDGRTCGISLWPFLNSSSGWRLISSVFLTRTSCCKTTHAGGHDGAWPGWMVSVSVLPLTAPPRRKTSYSRYFLWIGAEVSSFCNYFLLGVGVVLPSRAEVFDLSHGLPYL